MKKKFSKKKVWSKPEVHVLNIKRDTFNGSGNGTESTHDKIPNKF